MYDLRLEPCPYVCTYVDSLISIAYDFCACIEFTRMWNSMIFLLVLNSYVSRSNILFQLRIKCVVTTLLSTLG